MGYTQEQLQKINIEYESALKCLDSKLEDLVTHLHPHLKVEKAQEYLAHGVCRRLGIILRCIENIFRIFPPSRTKLLTKDERADVEINLHALVININGLQDNLAAVFLHEKGLISKLRRVNIGLYEKKTQTHFPPEMLRLLNSDTLKSWHERYSKDFRDALAHRIPIYVPPFAVARADSERYKELDGLAWEFLQRGDLKGYESAQAEQESLCKLMAVFLHSVSADEGPAPVRLHVQIICDALTAVELVNAVQPHL